jgi:hypothetical protein
MTLTQLFEQVRNHYLGSFERAMRHRVQDPAAWLIEHTFGPPPEDEENGATCPCATT